MWSVQLVVLLFLSFALSNAMKQDMSFKSMGEFNRVVEFFKRGYSYPVEKYVPDNPGWCKLMSDRLEQIGEIEEFTPRFEGFCHMTHAAMRTPDFTEHGLGLVKCPEPLLASLQAAVQEGLPTAEIEPDTYIEGPLKPWLIRKPELIAQVLAEFQHVAEEWVGIPLTPSKAYGFRVYRDGSQLLMHNDHLDTNVIGVLLHVASSADSEPWPFFIEDLEGRTHEIVLTPGDILLYEAAKLLHGRPRPFKGTWHTSVYAHYRPAHGWLHSNVLREAFIAVPPQFFFEEHSGTRKHRKLVMVGTSYTEPGSPDGWHGTVDTVKWSGPAKAGFLMTPGLEPAPFHPKKPFVMPPFVMRSFSHFPFMPPYMGELPDNTDASKT
jgi:hypothetical protein